jgi:hypothetical protein
MICPLKGSDTMNTCLALGVNADTIQHDMERSMNRRRRVDDDDMKGMSRHMRRARELGRMPQAERRMAQHERRVERARGLGGRNVIITNDNRHKVTPCNTALTHTFTRLTM